MSGPRVVFHVQHLLGIGHQRRAAAIARALAHALGPVAGAGVHYVSGGMPVAGLDVGGCTFHQLPPARVGDAGFAVLLDEQGRPVDEAWKRRRRDRLLHILDGVAPRLIVTETFPFGRGLLRFELLPLLEWAGRHAAVAVCSVRDIVEPRDDPAKLERMADEALAHYRAVLVHGDEQVLPFSAGFAPWRRVAPLLHYTGYVLERVPPRRGRAERDGPVLVSCGGGRVGEALLRTALGASGLCEVVRSGWELRVGQDAQAPWVQALRRRAPAHVTLRANRGGFVDDLARAAVSVSQAGYNTVAELLASGTPCVLVPYPAEREQGLRARAFAGRGAVRMLEADTLTPRRLASAVDEVFQAPEAGVQLRLDGVQNSVQHVLRLLG